MIDLSSPTSAGVLDIAAAIRSPDLRRALENAPDAFAGKVFARRYAAEELVLSPEGIADGLYIVVRGAADVASVAGERVATRGAVFGALTPRPGRERAIPVGLAVVEGDRVWARAVTQLDLWYVPRADFAAACTAVPGLSRAIEFLHWMQHAHRTFADALSGAVLLRKVARDHLATLIDRAERVDADAHGLVLAGGTPRPGVHLVLRGTVEGTPPLRLEAGAVFGDVETLLDGTAREAVHAGANGALLARLPFTCFGEAFQASPTLRRSRDGSGYERLFLTTFVRSADPEILLLQSDDARVPLARLTEGVARVMHGTWQDPVLVVGIVASRPAARVEVVRGAPRLELSRDQLGTGTDAPALIRTIGAALAARGRSLAEFTEILLDPFEPDVQALVAPAVTRVVYVARNPLTPLQHAPLRSRPVRLVALMGAQAVRTGRLPPATLRLALDVDRLAAHDGAWEDLGHAERAAIGRLARGVTERLVGVALGGGGAWGYAHAALLEELLTGPDAVPIDLVAGTSFGSLLGAFFCCDGLDGLRLLVARGRLANLTLAGGLFTSRAVAVFVDRHLRERRLEDLPLPLFPVATDVVHQRPFVPRSGTVGWGVRLSTAFPPLLTGVLHRDMRLVDGGFVNNVPASVAAQEGASLVVASSIVSTAPKAHRFAEHGPIGRALSEFSPFARVHDATRSALGVFHATGMVESRLADVVFQPTFSTPDFVNMRVGRQVIEAARESALATAAVVKARWRELCAPLTRPAWANP